MLLKKRQDGKSIGNKSLIIIIIVIVSITSVVIKSLTEANYQYLFIVATSPIATSSPAFSTYQSHPAISQPLQTPDLSQPGTFVFHTVR